MRDKILNGEVPIAYFGGGYIGTSGSIGWAEIGVKVIIYDINKEVVDKINKGEAPLVNLEFFIQTRFNDLVNEGLIRATYNKEDMPKGAVILIAVPSEKDALPWWEPIRASLIFARSLNPRLVVMESTLSVKMLENIQREFFDLPFVVASRRDWFQSPNLSLKVLDRIYGSDKPEIAEMAHEVLSLVSPKLHRASSENVAALVKSVENSLLHLPIIYAQQLTKAYPDVPIGELLALCGTHHRIPYYYVQAKVSGYCIHASSLYVYDGARNKDAVTILREVIETNKDVPFSYFEPLKNYFKGKKILVLGISYFPEHKMSKNCAWEEIIEIFKDSDISIHDPYYTDAEITKMTIKRYESKWRENLGKYDGIFMLCNHKEYLRGYPRGIKRGAYVFDNLPCGWENYRKNFEQDGIYYFKPGDAYNRLVPQTKN